MKDVAVHFEHVSKKYRLGLGQASLPSLLKETIRKLLDRDTDRSLGREVLWALHDVTFDLKPGECLGLVGPNGAGKTTILKLLSRITSPTSGVISSSGRISALIELGAGFHPDLTGRENAYLNGAILGLSRKYISSHLDEIVEFSGLSKFIDTPIKRYSSGMTVRLGFAVASSLQPEILLVDEVLAVGDAAFQRKCLDRIKLLIQAGTAIIFVSHNLYLVQAVCNRALYIDHGRILRDGSTSEIIAAYERSLHEVAAMSQETTGHSCEEHQTDVEITSIDVLAARDNFGAGKLKSANPAVIRIDYRAATEIPSANVSVFVKRADGLVCCMLRTSATGDRFRLRPGSGSIFVHLERLQLRTGSYYVQAYFLNDDDCLALTELSTPCKRFFVEGSGISSAADSGVFEPSLRWSRTLDAIEPQNDPFTHTPVGGSLSCLRK